MSRRDQAIALGVGTAASAAIVPVGGLAVIASPMVFDNPYNLENPVAWIAFLLVLGLWIVCIAGPYGAWVAFIKRQERLQWIAIGAPFAWGLAMILAFLCVPN